MTEQNMHICKALSGIFSAGLGFAFNCHHGFILWDSEAWVWVGFEGPAFLVIQMLKVF